MIAWTRNWLPLVLLMAVVALVAIGCNSSIDDPDKSENQVTVSGAKPTEACVDVDGELIDEDGDGTKESRVFTSFEQTIGFSSRVRAGAKGPFHDVIFTSVDIAYSMGRSAPPNRTEGVTITVPSGGTSNHGMTTILSTDTAAGYFILGDKGWIDMTFRGKDAAGKPMTATGRFQVRTATACGGSGGGE